MNEDFSLSISKTRFETLCDDYFTKCINKVDKALKESKLKKEEIEEIILVGGSCKIPKIR